MRPLVTILYIKNRFQFKEIFANVLTASQAAGDKVEGESLAGAYVQSLTGEGSLSPVTD